MNGRPGWIERLRALQLESFELDRESNLQRLNVKLQLPTESRFSLAVPAAPPPLFNGDVEAIRPGHWALIVSLNHQLEPSKRLRNDELLVTNFGATRLRMELDRVPLRRAEHVSIRQLLDDFGRYLHLPRVKDSAVHARYRAGSVRSADLVLDGAGRQDRMLARMSE